MAARPLLWLLALSCAACTPRLSDAETERIASETRALLDDHPGAAQIDSAKLPPAISATRPNVVYATPEGLYIQSTRWLTSEWGLFVPRAAGFAPKAGADPSYERVRHGLYRYRIVG